MQPIYQGKLAVWYPGQGDLDAYQALAAQLDVPLLEGVPTQLMRVNESFFLTWRESSLKLLDKELLNKGGMLVEIEPRPGEQRSWPAPKDGALAQAIGRKTKTVVDATTGWAQDSLHLFRMGYHVTCIERSPVMQALLSDALLRLQQLDWVQRLQLQVPQLVCDDAIARLAALEVTPECIYIDPMFPPKRKKSALAKKSMTILHDLLGDDMDKNALFAAAWEAAGKRVVVKSPEYAEPLGAKPSASYAGKLLRYDVYLKT